MSIESISSVVAVVRSDMALHGPGMLASFDELGKTAYKKTLEHLPDQVVIEATSQAFLERGYNGERFTPLPSDILRCALEILSPVPLADLAWDNASGRAAISPIPPPMHRLVDDTANTMGGLEALWSIIRFGEVSAVDRLRSSYCRAYQSLRALWYMDVARQMHLPEEERNPELFAVSPGTASALPWDKPLLAISPYAPKPLMIPDRSEGVPMPPEVRELLNNIGKGGKKVE